MVTSFDGEYHAGKSKGVSHAGIKFESEKK
jgi:hypothetical protein